MLSFLFSVLEGRVLKNTAQWPQQARAGPLNQKSSVLTIWHQLMPAELNENKIPKERIKVYQFVVTLLIYTYTYIQEVATGRRVFYMLIFFTKGFLSILISTCFSELLWYNVPRNIEYSTCFALTRVVLNWVL